MPFKPRQDLSEDQLKQALDGCATEPIHTPGSIQPYGVMFVLDPQDHVIVQASDNLEPWLGVKTADALGKPLAAVIGGDQADIVRHIVVKRELQPLQSSVIKVGDKVFDAVAHLSDGYVVVELEIVDDPRTLQRDYFYDELRRPAMRSWSPITARRPFTSLKPRGSTSC